MNTGVAAVVEAQLGRPPRGLVGVAVRCPFGFPAVIETNPYLEDGRPFPTLLYLTCPSAVEAVGRAEAAGGVASLRRLMRDSAELRAALVELEEHYRRRRAELAEAREVDGGAVLQAGIGGPPLDEASCLHAYAAALLAATGEWLGPEGTSPEAAACQATTRHWHDRLGEFGPLWCMNRACGAFAPAEGDGPQ